MADDTPGVMTNWETLTQSEVDNITAASLDGNPNRDGILAEIDPEALPGILAAEERAWVARRQRERKNYSPND